MDSPTDLQKLPTVSLILVVRNEIDTIEDALASLLDQSYPKTLTELIFVDSQSDDNTFEYLKASLDSLTSSGYRSLRLLSNPGRILSTGWNIAIRASSSEITCRIDGHSRIASDYVEIGVNTLLSKDYRNIAGVGGILNPIGFGWKGQLIAFLYQSPFATGNSPFRRPLEDTTDTDTAAFALYWKDIMTDLGLFNEYLVRNQDIEFHHRLRKAGYRLLTNPKMHIDYYVRGTFSKLLRKSFNDGLWVIRSGTSYARHRIPLCFFLYLSVFGLISVLEQTGTIALQTSIGFMLCLPLMVYIVLSVGYAIKDGRSWYRFCMAPLYFLLHLSYGLGSFWGLLRRFLRRLITIFHKPTFNLD